MRWRGSGDIGAEVVHSNLVMVHKWRITCCGPTEETILSSNKDILEYGYSPSHNNCCASCMHCVICHKFNW